MIFGLLFQMTDITQIPVVFIYTFTFLFYTLGLSFFSGVGVLLIAFVVNIIIGLQLEKLQKEIMVRKDKRMNHTTEAINNIKTLKFYSWTGIFEDEIQKKTCARVQNVQGNCRVAGADHHQLVLLPKRTEFSST
jgi:ABC-type bacteriocin/lantibiotic exporter with double-glycine peptidase domain